jgi:hypothetical protein
VELVLVTCDPQAAHAYPGHRLLVMDSDPPTGTRDLPPNDDGQPTLYFDVVNEHAEIAKIPQFIHFCYANPNLSERIAALDEVRIVVRAQGGNYSHERSFRIIKPRLQNQHERGRLVMEPV